MRVFLTGGTGLLGSHLAEQLVQRGHEVVALVRSARQAEHLNGLGCVLVEGDIADDLGDIADHIATCTDVVHGAAMVYAGDDWARIRAVNVEGTRRVLDAARRAGVTRALHISSVAVYGAAPDPISEATPLDHPLHPLDLYGRSKREAELTAREAFGAACGRLVIVRPAAVYGERDRLMAPALARFLRLPFVPVFGRGANSIPAVYAGNVAHAMLTLLETPDAHGIYDVGWDGPVSQRALMTGLAEGMGRGARVVAIPAGLVRAVCASLSRLGVSAPGARHLSLNRVARLALADSPFRSERLRRELDWQPPFDHPSALRRTGRWVTARN